MYGKKKRRKSKNDYQYKSHHKTGVILLKSKIKDEPGNTDKDV